MVKTTDHVQKGRFSCSIRANHRDNLSVLDFHTDPANGLDTTKMLGNLLNPEFSLCRHARCLVRSMKDTITLSAGCVSHHLTETEGVLYRAPAALSRGKVSLLPVPW